MLSSRGRVRLFARQLSRQTIKRDLVFEERWGGTVTASIFATPRDVSSFDDCYFYHTMDVPGHGTVQGEWDLRPNLDAYLGGYDLAGKRFLDVGAANGIMTVPCRTEGR